LSRTSKVDWLPGVVTWRGVVCWCVSAGVVFCVPTSAPALRSRELLSRIVCDAHEPHKTFYASWISMCTYTRTCQHMGWCT
jgi:chemotaxis signal transduction protein